jgi:hypothetical protein
MAGPAHSVSPKPVVETMRKRFLAEEGRFLTHATRALRSRFFMVAYDSTKSRAITTSSLQRGQRLSARIVFLRLFHHREREKAQNVRREAGQ